MPIIPLQFKKIYTCSICKEEFEWNKESAWFGTIESAECVVCSDECKEKSGLKDD